MYAIVEIAGQQFKVAKNQKVFVHRLQDKEGSKVTFDNVLLLDDGKVTLGAPAIEGAAVTAKILKHLKGDKVIVFKKKRRKGYKVKNGHRQYLSEIQIETIVASGAKKAKKEEPKKESRSVGTKKAEPKKEAKPKVAAAPKPAAKKAPVKTATADDLKKIEGIGPKIAEIFAEAGIDTFAKLAKASQKELKAILEGAGSRYASKNPGSWPKQAKMAAEGNWDELKKWQDETKGGIEE
ncbi:50S ribosomal protein L21 [Aureibaculum sp. 2210JD6-5]|uniref:50S ribosomal protein L21 n=1 Tax=Aureibaculum sp. 2210JD6-5 TaxID=3103957 RepID=UPI002AAD0E33|nr:50S ribosomal protein L21 [Aureibaculum sp. 2210JD6-5]MDY7394924.1 50S ribosomal protein L21 [Aureibaculum sp. 2210JD6-5]